MHSPHPRSKLLGNTYSDDIENESNTEDDDVDPDGSYNWEDIGASGRRKRKAKKNKLADQSFKKVDNKITPKQKKK